MQPLNNGQFSFKSIVFYPPKREPSQYMCTEFFLCCCAQINPPLTDSNSNSEEQTFTSKHASSLRRRHTSRANRWGCHCSVACLKRSCTCMYPEITSYAFKRCSQDFDKTMHTERDKRLCTVTTLATHVPRLIRPPLYKVHLGKF